MPKLKHKAVFVNPATGEDVVVKFDDITECREFVQVGHWAHINVQKLDYYEQ